MIGRVVGFVEEIGPLVTFPGTAVPSAARSTVRIEDADIGRQVTLVFEEGDSAKPIVTGVLQGLFTGPVSEGVAKQTQLTVVKVDGSRLVLSGEDEVVLQCGLASITLTRAGKVIVRGEYLLSRSSGLNKIVGGSVQIN